MVKRLSREQLLRKCYFKVWNNTHNKWDYFNHFLSVQLGGIKDNHIIVSISNFITTIIIIMSEALMV